MKSPKLVLRQARLNYYRKAQKLDRLGHLGRPSIVARTASFRFHSRISIGAYCRIGPDCVLDGEGGLSVGNGTIFAPKVSVLTGSHDYDQMELLPYGADDKLREVEIGAGCWLGWGAIIGPGVTIGDGAIVGLGSVVVADVSPGEIVGGNPARVLRTRDESTPIAELVNEERFYLRHVLETGAVRRGREAMALDDLIR